MTRQNRSLDQHSVVTPAFTIWVPVICVCSGMKSFSIHASINNNAAGNRWKGISLGVMYPILPLPMPFSSTQLMCIVNPLPTALVFVTYPNVRCTFIIITVLVHACPHCAVFDRLGLLMKIIQSVNPPRFATTAASLRMHFVFGVDSGGYVRSTAPQNAVRVRPLTAFRALHTNP